MRFRVKKLNKTVQFQLLDLNICSHYYVSKKPHACAKSHLFRHRFVIIGNEFCKKNQFANTTYHLLSSSTKNSTLVDTLLKSTGSIICKKSWVSHHCTNIDMLFHLTAKCI